MFASLKATWTPTLLILAHANSFPSLGHPTYVGFLCLVEGGSVSRGQTGGLVFQRKLAIVSLCCIHTFEAQNTFGINSTLSLSTTTMLHYSKKKKNPVPSTIHPLIPLLCQLSSGRDSFIFLHGAECLIHDKCLINVCWVKLLIRQKKKAT